MRVYVVLYVGLWYITACDVIICNYQSAFYCIIKYIIYGRLFEKEEACRIKIQAASSQNAAIDYDPYYSLPKLKFEKIEVDSKNLYTG